MGRMFGTMVPFYGLRYSVDCEVGGSWVMRGECGFGSRRLENAVGRELACGFGYRDCAEKKDGRHLRSLTIFVLCGSQAK